MEYNLNRKLRLKTDPEYKNLYTWAINEILEDGKIAQRDQIPWGWTLYFTATECSVFESFSIEPDYENTDDDSATKAITRPSIDMRLRPGYPDEGSSWQRTRFSMFGTDRILDDIRLNIRPTTEPDEKESCKAWGCVSYTSENDFRYETQDDILIFYLFVAPETFSRYAEMVRAGQIDQIVFSAGRVAGFYSDWSPSISTSSVKVLAAGKEQDVDMTAGTEIKLPRLGSVGECSLRINRQIVFKRQEDDAAAGDPMPEEETPPPPRNTLPTVSGSDPQVRQLLQSLKKAAWWIICLLVLILLTLLFRR